MPFSLLQGAIDDASGAYVWYGERSPDVATEFLGRIEAALLLVQEFPAAGTPGRSGTRRILLRPFPYVLVYRVDGPSVVVVAVAHTSRGPGSRL